MEFLFPPQGLALLPTAAGTVARIPDLYDPTSAVAPLVDAAALPAAPFRTPDVLPPGRRPPQKSSGWYFFNPILTMSMFAY